MKKLILVFHLSLLAIFAVSIDPQAVSAQTDSMILLSDIHFQPDLKKTTFATDCDTGLLLSAIKSIKEVNAHPKYILITGDFICHSSVDNINNNEKTNVIRYVAHALKSEFSKAIIIPALGNNDSYEGDYIMKENDPFYTMFFQSFFAGDNRNLIDNKFYNRQHIGGYYAYRPKTDPHLTVVVLNTTLFSPRADADKKFANDELAWLNSVLEKCAAEKQHVWIMYHIPPGADAHKALTKGKNTGMWKDAYNDAYIKTVKKYRNIIQAQFAGHTHNDDFRLIDEGNKAIAYIHITPSVTPIHGNNPAFQQAYFDAKKYVVTDYATYYSPTEANWELPGMFEKEYDFKETYGTPLSLQQLALMRSNKYKNIGLFKKYYVVSAHAPVADDDKGWDKFFEYTIIK